MRELSVDPTSNEQNQLARFQKQCQGLGSPRTEAHNRRSDRRVLLQALVRERGRERLVQKQHLLDREQVAHEDPPGGYAGVADDP